MSTPYVGNNLAQKVKQILINELRYYFQSVSQFGFPSSPIKMPIIREAFSLTSRLYPAIIIKILHEETRNISIGRDYAEDVFSDDQLVGQKYLPGTEDFKVPVPYRRRVVAERYGYMSDITFNIQVMADTTPVRNKTVDEICAALRYYQRESMLTNGIQMTRLSMGEETDYPLNASEKIYIANLNFVVNAELYFDNKVNSVTAVNTYKFKTNSVNPHMEPYILQPGQKSIPETINPPNVPPSSLNE
jgi:hypothetical protein